MDQGGNRDSQEQGQMYENDSCSVENELKESDEF